jgi:5-(carboxyamino)imidazole ribonucleotide synthase
MNTQTIGIIGDGQLGMLLCEAAPALGLQTIMLTSAPECAAARRAGATIEGAMDDSVALADLIARCDVITYEREDVPPRAIAQLREAEASGDVDCYPPLSAIEIIQDKARQKNWLADSALATLPFVISDGSQQSHAHAALTLGFPLVQKALRGGFDGRGVQILRDPSALDKAWPGETLFEKYAGDFREIAVLAVRGRDGEISHFGPVDMTFEQDYAVLDTVIAPADISPDTERTAIDLAYRAVEALNGVGVFGVEMFLLGDGQVLINEISPRVHNAGHYTLEACTSSQFELHLRAVSGMPLSNTAQRRSGVMRNLLCTPALKHEDLHREAQVINLDSGARVYWYGKSPARLMRKLGHITALADSVTEARSIVDACWEQIQKEAEST